MSCSIKKNKSQTTDCLNRLHSLPITNTVIDSTNSYVSLDSLDRIANHLYDVMLSPDNLSIEQDRQIIMLMNSIFWKEHDNSIEKLNNISILKSFEQEFNNRYLNLLICSKYKVSQGRGMSINFDALKIQYGGTPSSNSRYLIK